jgi:hypothetical protein
MSELLTSFDPIEEEEEVEGEYKLFIKNLIVEVNN